MDKYKLGREMSKALLNKNTTDVYDFIKGHNKSTLELMHTMENYLLIINFKGEIVIASDSIFKNTNAQRAEVFSSSFYKRLYKYDGTPLDLFDLLLLNTHKPNLELSFKTSDNQIVPTMVVSSSLLKNFYNDDDYILLLLADIREQRKNQSRLMQSNKLISLGEMATNIAHEINNPLTIIKGQVEILRKQLLKDEIPVEKAITLTEKVEKNVLRIDKIIKSLKVISRNNEDVPRKENSLKEIFDGLSDLSQERLKMASVKYEVIGLSPDYKIYCNETEIIQVFINLIKNSIDEIANLDEKWIKIGIQTTEDNFVISFIDSGNGIDLESQISLFEPFYTTKDIGKGTGLGLSISKGILDSHGGSLYYEQKNSNTCFKITLPIQTDYPSESDA